MDMGVESGDPVLAPLRHRSCFSHFNKQILLRNGVSLAALKESEKCQRQALYSGFFTKDEPGVDSSGSGSGTSVDDPGEKVSSNHFHEVSLAKIRERIEQYKDKCPPHVLQVIEENFTMLEVLAVNSVEFNIHRNHLHCLTKLPWGSCSDEYFDVPLAQKIVYESHFGQTDVKKRLWENIVVGKHRGTSHGKIICLSGLPGVGKTSFACSAARALNPNFCRILAGDLADVAEIKGHYRTDIEATPGKLVKCLQDMGTFNAVVIIDEIDKLDRDNVVKLTRALLEFLDPEQNANFLDHYIGVPIDLSKVRFLCTASFVEDIPQPLFDRMEEIHISGYIPEEKMHIARDYFERAICEECCINPAQVEVTDAALLSLIENYCREPGLHNLRKLLTKIYRQIAVQFVKQGSPSEVVAGEVLELDEAVRKVVVDEANLEFYVGKPLFRDERIFDQTPVGVAMGLAWNEMGGSTLYVETAVTYQVVENRPLLVTGLLGHVMQESVEVARTLALSVLREKEPKNLFFANSKIHVHFPSGAIPKDGPSASSAITTSMLSCAMEKPVRKDLAMTGEVTLTGKVLPIGGVKEKMMAARRNHVKTIIFPSANRRDFDELAPSLKESIEFVHFVDDYSQIFDLAFSFGQNEDN